MVMHKLQPEDAFRPLANVTPPFIPYRDAGSGPATFYLTVLDCLRGLYRAMQFGLFSFADFSLEEYEMHEKIEFGDLNWISPKFVAFASPIDDASEQQRPMWPASALAEYFAQNNVCTVVRLNDKLYDRSTFTKKGLEHVEMHFPDGTCPPEHILRRFMDLCESRSGMFLRAQLSLLPRENYPQQENAFK
jgi:cell division cycle 14